MRLRGYIFSRQFMGERVPQNIQNLVIRDYCQKGNNKFLLSATEYAMDNSSYIFNQILRDINNIDGIVAYSVFQLPCDDKTRIDSLSLIVGQGKQIHFAAESLKVVNNHDINRINLIWKTRKAIDLMESKLEWRHHE